MTERVRARQSPYRDLMLELHKQGVKVKFYSGRAGQENADVFFVQLPESMDLEDSCEILRRIDEAMARSIEQSPPRLLSFASAIAFVENIESLNRGLIEQEQPQVPTEPEFTDLQSGKIDALLCQEDKNGNKKERQPNLPL